MPWNKYSCSGSYIDSPDWIKNKKAAINPLNKNDNKCFQYAVIIALYYEEIKNDPQKITKIKPFMTGKDKYSVRKRWFEKIWGK